MTDCFALKGKRCTVLNVRECQGQSCPFYKTTGQQQYDAHEAMDKLVYEGRQDLIDKYHYRGAGNGCDKTKLHRRT